jgi:hypothetical protein
MAAAAARSAQWLPGLWTGEVAEEMDNRLEGQAGEEDVEPAEVEGVKADKEMKPQHKEQIIKMAITLKDFSKEETGDIDLSSVFWNSPLRQALPLDTERTFASRCWSTASTRPSF